MQLVLWKPRTLVVDDPITSSECTSSLVGCDQRQENCCKQQDDDDVDDDDDELMTVDNSSIQRSLLRTKETNSVDVDVMDV